MHKKSDPCPYLTLHWHVWHLHDWIFHIKIWKIAVVDNVQCINPLSCTLYLNNFSIFVNVVKFYMTSVLYIHLFVICRHWFRNRLYLETLFVFLLSTWEDEVFNEINLISGIHYKNLVKLLCWRRSWDFMNVFLTWASKFVYFNMFFWYLI